MELKIKSWKECTISKYYKICDIIEDDEIQTYDKEVALLALLCDCEENEIWELNFNEFKKLQSMTSWIGEIELKKIENLKFKTIIIDNKKYSINGDLSKFTTAQYIDFQTFWAKRNTSKMKDIIGNILVCFIIPYGHKYGDGYDLQETAKTIYDNLDIETAYEIISFFFRSWVGSIKDSLTYSALKMKKLKKKMSKEEWHETIKNLVEMEQSLIDGFCLLTTSVN